MNKRGVEERQILYIAYILLCLIAIAILYGKVRAEARGETFHQLYYARDIALASNLFGRGNLTVYYPLRHDFNFAVANGKVIVRKEDVVIYEYSDGKKYSISSEKKEDKLILGKKT